MVATAGCAYSRDLSTLSAAQARSDLDYLAQQIDQIHPDPYWQVNQTVFRHRVDQIKQQVDGPISRWELFRHAQEMAAMVQNYHTRLDPSSAMTAEEMKNLQSLPLLTVWSTGCCRVAGCAEGFEPGRIHIGDEVVSIDGQSVNEWLLQHEQYSPGETHQIRMAILAADLFAWFWLLDGPRGSFDVVLRGADGPYQVHVKATPVPCLRRFAESSYWRDGEICLLKIRTWHDGDQGHIQRDRRRLLAKVCDCIFARMRQCKSRMLILDLRGNGGGSLDLCDEFIGRFASRPWGGGSTWQLRDSAAGRHAWVLHTAQQQGIPRWLVPETLLAMGWLGPPIPRSCRQDGDMRIWCDLRTRQPAKDLWPGAVVVLVDSMTASAAHYLAATVQHDHLGWVAGQESLGANTEVGYPVRVVLPYSGLWAWIGCTKVVWHTDAAEGDGVAPDIPLDPLLPDAQVVERIWQAVFDTAVPAKQQGT